MKPLLPILASCGLSVCFADAALADRYTEIAEIRAQLQALNARLEALEAAPASQGHAVTAASVAPARSNPPATGDRANHAKLAADLRYRHEGIDQQGNEQRTRHRIRARVGVTAQLSETAELGVRLASGNDDPVSTNQTLDDGASTKSVGLDLAYLSLAPTPNTKIIGGKMRNPLYRVGGSSLLWDGDLSPEGLAMRFGGDSYFVNAAGFWIEERGSASDSLLLGAQAGWRTELANGSRLTVGFGHFDYTATRGRSPFFNGDGQGNTLDAMGNYLFDYSLTEVFAEWRTKIQDLPFSLFAHWVQNGDAAVADTGVALGGKLGRASSRGSWEAGYTYKDLEADAVIATFTDSDIGGGGTAVRGHVFDFGYAFTKRIGARLTYFMSENRIDTPGERDYQRLQADLSLKY